MSISRRTATINGETIAYTYNTANRTVAVPAKGIEFIATCYDAAKHELGEALAEVARMAELAAAPAKRTVLIGKTDGVIHAASNYKTKCTGKSRDFHIERTADAVTCPACIAVEASAATQRETATAARATDVKLANVFRTEFLTHNLVILADGTPAPKCRNRPTKGEALYAERARISCNSCSGAHLPGTHLGA